MSQTSATEATPDPTATAPSEMATEVPPGRRRRGRSVTIGLAALLAGGTATAVLISGTIGAPANAGPATTLPPDTAAVTRQTLTATLTVDGELGHGTTTTVANRLAGTVTWLPETDSRIARGQDLYRVDETPVTLMYGAVPAYRTLEPGTEGPDVAQLEENLSALGYTGFTVDDEYTSATAEAVESWQEDRGLDETGVVELGRVVFAPGEVRVDSLATAQGKPAAPGQEVLTYTGTAMAATATLDDSDRRLAQPGTPVEVTLPDDTTLTGRVDEVTTAIVPATGQGEAPETVVEVVVGLDDQNAAASYALAAVDVTFTAEERPDVLAVPVAALLALGEGGFGVEVVEGTTSRYVAVYTGLFADGMVEISGAGIAEGTEVGMPA